MDWQTLALAAAGGIGCVVALIHGALTHRYLVLPGLKAAGDAPSGERAHLAAALLQYSTFSWFAGGVALIAVSLGPAQAQREVAAWLVGTYYLYGAAANLLTLKRLHPGWVLYAAAVALIFYGAWPAGS